MFFVAPLLWADYNPQAMADLAWSHRDQPGQTEQAIKIWADSGPLIPDVQIRLTKAYGRLYRHAKTSEERVHWADLARASGAKAIDQFPNSSDAYAAYGEALGQWARAHTGISSLKTVRMAVSNLNKAVELKPDNAYAHMLLASFYLHAPRFVSVGDKAKALEHARLAAQYGPGYAIDHLVLARVYLDQKKKADAVAELQKIVRLQPPADAIPETRADQETAAEMLKSLEQPDEK